MKTNTITTILANKGSGKTILATALTLAQDKPTIFISPIKNSLPLHFRDKVDSPELQEDFYNGITYAYYPENQDELEELLESLENIDNICIAIDEIDFYYNNTLDNTTELYKLINYGRHRQIDLVIMARRFQNIPKALVSQTDIFYIGRIGRSYADLEYIRKTIDKETAELAQSLERGIFIRVENIKDTLSLIKLPNDLVAKIEKRTRNEY